MDLETVIQSEVSQKEKNTVLLFFSTLVVSYINTHMWNHKNGIDELIFKEIEMQI